MLFDVTATMRSPLLPVLHTGRNPADTRMLVMPPNATEPVAGAAGAAGAPESFGITPVGATNTCTHLVPTSTLEMGGAVLTSAASATTYSGLRTHCEMPPVACRRLPAALPCQDVCRPRMGGDRAMLMYAKSEPRVRAKPPRWGKGGREHGHVVLK